MFVLLLLLAILTTGSLLHFYWWRECYIYSLAQSVLAILFLAPYPRHSSYPLSFLNEGNWCPWGMTETVFLSNYLGLYCCQCQWTDSLLTDDPVFWDRVLLSQHYPAIAGGDRDDAAESGPTSATRRTSTTPGHPADAGDLPNGNIKTDHWSFIT